MACSIGSNLELDVATAAMAHLVVACPNMQVEKYPGDLLGADYHEIRIAKNPVRIEGPITTITDRPGLGVEVDWAAGAAVPLRLTEHCGGIRFPPRNAGERSRRGNPRVQDRRSALTSGSLCQKSTWTRVT